MAGAQLAAADEAPIYQRAENDAFYTDPRLASAIVQVLINDRWVEPAIGSVLEPSVGRGAFVDAILPHVWERGIVHAIDVDPVAVAAINARNNYQLKATLGDFLDPTMTAGREYEALIGNPPFGKKVEGKDRPEAVAEKHVRRALALRARGGCAAFLLRSAFLESIERIPFWREHPASAFYPLAERPSYTGDGKTDKGQAYCLLIWKRGHRGQRVLGDHIIWKGDK